MQIALGGRIGYTHQLSVHANFSHGSGDREVCTDALKSDIDFAVVKPNVKLSISNYTLSRADPEARWSVSLGSLINLRTLARPLPGALTVSRRLHPL